MWWGNSPDKPQPPQASPAEKPKEQAKEVVKDAKTAVKSFDPDKLPNREKLPKGLQRIVDKADRDENFYNELVDGYVPESTESNVRYAAYMARLRTIMLSAHRYVAYTSDIGESFRPVAHPHMVRSAYGISWAYILGDVSYEGYKAYWSNQRRLHPELTLTARQAHATGLEASDSTAHIGTVTPLEDYRTVMIQRGIFQSIASMGLPAFTIHSVVRYSGRALKDVKNKTIRTWGPIGLGLAVVPFLPTLFDKPVENAVEWTFHKAFQTVGGKQAVGNAPTMGREKELIKKPGKEKEL